MLIIKRCFGVQGDLVHSECLETIVWMNHDGEIEII
jgi:hypothetical protein